LPILPSGEIAKEVWAKWVATVMSKQPTFRPLELIPEWSTSVEFHNLGLGKCDGDCVDLSKLCRERLTHLPSLTLPSHRRCRELLQRLFPPDLVRDTIGDGTARINVDPQSLTSQTGMKLHAIEKKCKLKLTPCRCTLAMLPDPPFH
jgi:hypothetical protein